MKTMPSRNVDLSEHFDHFIDAEIRSGRFRDASEIVHEGLHLLEQREEEERAKLKWLRGTVQESLDSVDRGEFTTLRSREEIEEYLASRGAKREVASKS